MQPNRCLTEKLHDWAFTGTKDNAILERMFQCRYKNRNGFVIVLQQDRFTNVSYLFIRS